MIGMGVRKSNALNAAVDGLPQRLEVRRISWAWVDDPALDDVRVRAVQG
jgi:hypothetical protein